MAPETKIRRPWLTALLSFICPGLGQVYAGQTKFGFRLFSLAVGLTLLFSITLMVSPLSTMVLFLALGLGLVGVGVQLWAAIAAFVSVRKARVVTLTRYNRVLVYGAMFAVTAGVGEVSQAKWSPYMLWENFNIPAASMLPTLNVGDYLVTERFAWRDRAPERGELAIFKLPSDEKIDYVKRIIGLPGDRIQMRRGRLIINGTEIRRDRVDDYEDHTNGRKVSQYRETLPNGRRYKIIEARGDTGALDNTREYVVPDGQVFALGDNRDNSLDSRVLANMSTNHWVGFIPIKNLYAKPGIIYWSRDWSRLGLTVE